MNEVEVLSTINTIEVLSKTQRIIVESPSSVSVVRAGPIGPSGITGPIGQQGDKGDKGDKGDQGIPGEEVLQAFVFNQGSPEGTWRIEHNLGFYPNITVVDSAGSLAEGVVRYIDMNIVEIDFSSPFGGLAYLS